MCSSDLRPATHRAVVVALLMAAALATKNLLAAPAVGAAWLIVLERRRWRDVVGIPVGAAIATVVTAVPWGLRAVYEQSIAYHTSVDAPRDVVANLRKAGTTLWRRDLPLLVLALRVLRAPARPAGEAVGVPAAGGAPTPTTNDTQELALLRQRLLAEPGPDATTQVLRAWLADTK